MTIQTKPNIQIAWADNGDKTEIVEAKLHQGWISEIPKAEDENFLQNRQDTGLIHIFQTGIAQWDSITPYTAGKSYVQGSDGNIYISVTDSVGSNPISTPAWRLLVDKSSKVVNESRTISTGTGLTGGGNLTTNRTISLANSGVNPGNYGSSGSVSALTVDSTGRILGASNQAIDFATPMNNRSVGSDGYQVFPGGFTIMWRFVKVAALTDTYVPFPFPFPSICVSVLVSPTTNYAGTMETALSVGAFDKNGVYIRNQYVGDSSGDANVIDARIVAFGY